MHIIIYSRFGLCVFFVCNYLFIERDAGRRFNENRQSHVFGGRSMDLH